MKRSIIVYSKVYIVPLYNVYLFISHKDISRFLFKNKQTRKFAKTFYWTYPCSYISHKNRKYSIHQHNLFILIELIEYYMIIEFYWISALLFGFYWRPLLRCIHTDSIYSLLRKKRGKFRSVWLHYIKCVNLYKRNIRALSMTRCDVNGCFFFK